MCVCRVSIMYGSHHLVGFNVKALKIFYDIAEA